MMQQKTYPSKIEVIQYTELPVFIKAAHAADLKVVLATNTSFSFRIFEEQMCTHLHIFKVLNNEVKGEVPLAELYINANLITSRGDGMYCVTARKKATGERVDISGGMPYIKTKDAKRDYNASLNFRTMYDSFQIAAYPYVKKQPKK